MKAFVITLENNEYSEHVADRCISTAASHKLVVDKFYGVGRDTAKQVMHDNGLEWTWAKGNKANDVCIKTGLNLGKILEEISQQYNSSGGGHDGAASLTINMEPDPIVLKIIEKIKQYL